MFYLSLSKYLSSTTGLVNAIEQGLRAELGVVTEDDILMGANGLRLPCNPQASTG